MTNPKRVDESPKQVNPACDHVMHHECVMCGRDFQTADVILPGGYCGAACRKMASSLRRAEAAVDAPATPADVVLGLADRTQSVMGPRSTTPASIDGWLRLLGKLTDQLAADPRLHDHHRRLRAALNEALEQLDTVQSSPRSAMGPIWIGADVAKGEDLD